MENWISVKDRLPTYSEANMTRECIIAVKGGISQVSLYNDPSFDDYDEDDTIGFSYIHVTHWMPLPSPPKDKE